MATAKDIEERAQKVQDKYYPDVDLDYQAVETNTKPLFWELQVLDKGQIIGRPRFEDTDDLDGIEKRIEGYLPGKIKGWLDEKTS